MVKNICINGVNYCSAKNNVKIAFNIAIVLCVMITSVFVPSTSLQAQDLGLVQSYAKGFAIRTKKDEYDEAQYHHNKPCLMKYKGLVIG